MEIKFNSVSVLYPYEQYPTIDELNLTVDGKVNTLLVDIQSGKTTIAKLLTGLLKPTKGNITIDGKDRFEVSQEDRKCAYVTYPPILFENRSVQYNLEYPLIIRGVDKESRLQMTKQCATQYGLLDEFTTKVKRLDNDVKMRVAIARLAVRPLELLIVDDCLDKLNDENSKILNAIIEKQDVVTVNLTSDIDCAVGKIYLIQHSKLIAQGDYDTIKQAKQELLWLYDQNYYKDEVNNNE